VRSGRHSSGSCGVVLCTNVTAGISILEQASPMIQELFKGAIGPVAAGGFVGLLSLSRTLFLGVHFRLYR
jgi:hypothetical protein